MKKHFFFFLALFLLVLGNAFSQTNPTFEDVIYLKSGGITRGMILELVPDQSVKIQTADRNVFVYQMNEVLKITKEEVPAAASSTPNTQTQTQNDNRVDIARNFISSKINSESGGLLVLKGFTKTNGVEQNLGQKMYILEYKLTVEFTNNGWKGFDLMYGYFGDYYVAKTQPSAYLYGAGYDDMGREYKLYNKGSLVEITGELYMEYTDNGWRATDYENKGSKTTTTVTTTPANSSPGGTNGTTTVAVPKEPDLKCNEFDIANATKQMYALNYPGADPVHVSMLSLKDNSNGVCGQFKKMINDKMNAIMNGQDRLVTSFSGNTFKDSTQFELTLEDVKFEWKAGISQYDATKAYGGFFCYVTLKSHYKVNGKEIYSNTISLAGGSPSLNDSREASLTKALQTASPYILYELYHCYPLIVKINAVNDESNKGVVKEILIEGGAELGLQEDWEFLFYDPATGKTFGKCKLKKLNFQGTYSMCKVTDGEDILSPMLKSGTVMYVKTAY